MLVVFLYICVLKYILNVPQSVQSLSRESMNSREKYWRYNTLWKPNEDTEDYKKILSNFLSTMSKLDSLSPFSNFIDPVFVNDYYEDMFSQRSQPTRVTTSQFRKRDPVLTRFPYRHRSPKLSNRRTFQPYLHTQMVNKNKASYEDNYRYKDYWPRQHIKSTSWSKNDIPLKYSIHSFNYRPEFEINNMRNSERPMFRAVLSKPNQSFIQSNTIYDITDDVNIVRLKKPKSDATTETSKAKAPSKQRPSKKHKLGSPIKSTQRTSKKHKLGSPIKSTQRPSKKHKLGSPKESTKKTISANIIGSSKKKEKKTKTSTEAESTSPITTQIEDNETETDSTDKSTSTSPKDDVKVKCYMCGLNETGIPRAPTCYQVFDTIQRTAITSMRKYKVHCFAKKSFKRSNDNDFVGDLYREGCFKRFTDIGIVYNERGCRTMVPTEGKSFASQRLAKLELLLAHQDEGCVASPHASLTPFSRAISLFVRYHVCVCKGWYCNHATRLSEPPLLHSLLYIYLIYNNK